MQLTPADRRAIIEDLLDIQIFSSMNGVVKEKMAIIKDDTTKTKHEMDLTSERINFQKQSIEDHKNRNDVEIEKKKKEITTSIDQTFTLQRDIELIQKHINVLQKKIEGRFASKHPEKWIPLYSQVTFSHIPYHEALSSGIRQNAIMKEVMNRPDIEAVWDSEEIENEILKRI
jgi:hypothetical protein